MKTKTIDHTPSKIKKITIVFKRLIFVYLAAIILVIFSEKTYWYIQGFDFIEISLFYFFPTFMFLWIIEYFQISRLPQLFLAAAIYGFLVEGVLAPILYQDGLFGLFHISYTSLAWHAIISVIFGFYLLRKWLLENNVKRLVTIQFGFGFLWGLWSLTYWLPEMVNDPDFIEIGYEVGAWPT